MWCGKTPWCFEGAGELGPLMVFTRISVDAGQLAGVPCIRGLRRTVAPEVAGSNPVTHPNLPRKPVRNQ